MERLKFFPDLHQGELLYSAIARFSNGMSHESGRDSWRHLVGDHFQKPVFDLPFRLDDLAARLPAAWSLTGETLAHRHTLLPYYTAYASEAVAKEALAAMTGRAGKAGIIVGVRAKPLGPMSEIRFCRQCVEADMTDRGEAYLRRVHQIPIVTMCVEHACDLQISTIKIGKTSYLHPASETTCPADAPSATKGDDVDREMLLWLASRAQHILEGGAADIPDFQKMLHDRGFSRGVSRLGWDAFAKQATTILKPLEATFPGLLDGVGRVSGWLEHTMDPTRPCHPDAMLFALLVMDRIEGPGQPFGPPPWPCINPLASHKGDLCVTRIKGPEAIGNGQLRAWFTCDCGYVYTRSKRANGDIGRPYFVKFGPLLAGHVADSYRNGIGLYRAGQLAGLEKNTFVRAMGVEGIVNPWTDAPDE